MSADVVQLETEKDKAERYKAAIAAALEPVVRIMDEARKDGMLCSWEMGVDAYGRCLVREVAIVKRY